MNLFEKFFAWILLNPLAAVVIAWTINLTFLGFVAWIAFHFISKYW